MKTRLVDELPEFFGINFFLFFHEKSFEAFDNFHVMRIMFVYFPKEPDVFLIQAVIFCPVKSYILPGGNGEKLTGRNIRFFH